MDDSRHMDCGWGYGSAAAIFFTFICSALLALLYFSGRDFEGIPGVRQVTECLLVLLLLTGAYSGSARGCLFLPLNTALLGPVCALALCLMATGLKNGSKAPLSLLPLLLLLVPLHFALSVSGMRTAALLRSALRQNPQAEKSLRAQSIMMLLVFTASVCATAYIIFR